MSPGERTNPATTERRVEAALGIKRFRDERRQVAFGGVGDRAQDGEGHVALASEASCNQAFHVDRRGSCRVAQSRLVAGPEDRSRGAREPFERNPRACLGEALGPAGK